MEFIFVSYKSKLYNYNIIKKIYLLFVFPVVGKHGPATLAKSYIETLRIFINNKIFDEYFVFTITSHISFKNYINYTNKPYHIVWFLYSTYLTKINNRYSTNFYNTIYGPMVSPKKWLLFPQNNTYEIKWSYYVGRMFSYVVQSERVKKHLLNNSKKLRNIEKKYIVSHGCLLSNETLKILEWNKRKYDILIYAKFSDINKEKELQKLLTMLKRTYKTKLIRYGNHTKHSLLNYANNSKLLIYFSFYDCWPSSLMEMQNMGVFPIVQQKEFISIYGCYINDFVIDIKVLGDIIHNNLLFIHNSSKIAFYYRSRNSCYNVLKRTLCNIFYIKTHKMCKTILLQ